jgi:hypothetical protein
MLTWYVNRAAFLSLPAGNRLTSGRKEEMDNGKIAFS